MKTFVFAVAACLLPATVLADTKIVTWNTGVSWDGAIEAREAEFMAAGEAIGANVYVLQEVISLNGAKRIAELLGVEDPQIVISDFASVSDQTDDSDKANPFFHLEVAVISDVPIVSATELEFDGNDASGPLSNVLGLAMSRKQLFVPSEVWDTISGQTQNVLRFGRGVLRVELEGDLVVYGIHAKSEISGYCFDAAETIRLLKRIESRSDDESGLPADEIMKLEGAVGTLEALIAQEEATSFSKNWITNAEKREAMLSAVASEAADDVSNGKTVVVLGDFNIAIDDPRSGSDLSASAECNPTRSCFEVVEDSDCAGQDGLDDSHFLISGGVEPNLTMTPLTSNLDETLLGEFSSVIDHIYVSGQRAEDFTEAVVVRDQLDGAFGSDHLPVVTELAD